MEKLYRFRSARALLEQFHELEKHEIYFADYDSLNDPMEGFQQFVWEGDRMLWRNLLKHYIFCLYHCAILLSVHKEYSLSVSDLPIYQWEGELTTEGQRTFSTIIDRFFAIKDVTSLLSMLETLGPLSEYDLTFYLERIHKSALQIVFDAIPIRNLKLGRVKKDVLLKIPKEWYEEEKTESYRKKIKQITTTSSMRSKSINLLGHYLSYRKYNNDTNQMFDIHIYFPNLYVEAIKKLVLTDVFLACFMEDYKNSASWGHYADSHKGACLIFEPADLRLRQSNKIGANYKQHPLIKVKYNVSYPEVDFFNTIRRVPVKQLIKQWYTDENGKEAQDKIAEINSFSDLEKNLERWADFHSGNAIKFKDWEYEVEHRIILSSGDREYDKPENRKFTYDFLSLKGIIFGLRTSLQDKLEIICTIERLCRKYKRTEFKFYQATPATAGGSIEINLLDVKLYLEEKDEGTLLSQAKKLIEGK